MRKGVKSFFYGKLAEMGRAARKLAEQRADWEINFQVMLGAYELAFQRSN